MRIACNDSNSSISGICLAQEETGTELTDLIEMLYNVSILIFTYLALLRLAWASHPMFSDFRSPNMVPYWIPFFGSTYAFWSDITGFLVKYRKKYKSDIFAAYIGGRPIVFVTDPFAAAKLISGRIPQLSWSDTKFRLLNHAMQTSEEGANVWAQMDSREGHMLMEKHLMKAERLNENLIKYQRNLKSKILPALAEEGGVGWHKIGIMELIGEAIYRSTAESLYGYQSFSTHSDFKQSVTFDKNMALFTGIKSGLLQRLFSSVSFNAREDMVEKMRQVYRSLENSSERLSDMAVDVDNLYNEKMNHEDLTRYRYLYFAAAFMNTVPAGFWSFYEIMASKEAYNAVTKEIFEIASRKLQQYSTPNEEKKTDNPYSTMQYFTLDELDQLECLDSVITETLRLRSTNKMLRVRYATEDFEIKLNFPLSSQTHQFNVKKGTYFVSLPTVMHRDPEIFEDPLTFKWNRFMKSSNGKAPIFTKNGKRILRPVDAFGGGQTMCPGRKFARTEIKAVIVSLLLQYDVRFPEGKVPEPPIDHTTFVNSGMPLHEVDVEVCKKS